MSHPRRSLQLRVSSGRPRVRYRAAMRDNGTPVDDASVRRYVADGRTLLLPSTHQHRNRHDPAWRLWHAELVAPPLVSLPPPRAWPNALPGGTSRRRAACVVYAAGDDAAEDAWFIQRYAG